MKHVKMFGKSVPLIAIALVGLLTIGAGATLLTYYGSIGGTVTVKQAVLVDHKGIGTPITEEFGDVTGGDIVYTSHFLENMASIPAPVRLRPLVVPDGEGVTVKYLKSANYKKTVTTVPVAGTHEVDVTVEDTGEWIQWTFDFLKHCVGDPVGDGAFRASVTISFDGGTPDIHVHNNDGTCSAYPWGTWLYSEYSDGWHTGEEEYNTPVEDISWIDAIGETEYTSNADGKLIVKIRKAYLGESFYWGVWVATTGGFSNPGYSMSAYPNGFDWSSTPVLEKAIILQEITEVTLGVGEVFDFTICYTFPIAAAEGYTITTYVDVA